MTQSTKTHVRFDIVYTEQEIQENIAKLAQQLLKDFPELLQKDRTKTIIFESLLNGAVIFTRDLLRELKKHYAKNFKLHKTRTASYGSETVSSGSLKIENSLSKEQIAGKTVIILDDVCDSGLTINKLKNKYEQMGAKVKIAVAVDKQTGRKIEYENYRPDYSMFVLKEPLWLEGYGMDTDGRGRRRKNIVQVINL